MPVAAGHRTHPIQGERIWNHEYPLVSGLLRSHSLLSPRCPSTLKASRAVAAGAAVADKPIAEVSGEFGAYDDLLVRFRRADLDGEPQ